MHGSPQQFLRFTSGKGKSDKKSNYGFIQTVFNEVNGTANDSVKNEVEKTCKRMNKNERNVLFMFSFSSNYLNSVSWKKYLNTVSSS